MDNEPDWVARTNGERNAQVEEHPHHRRRLHPPARTRKNIPTNELRDFLVEYEANPSADFDTLTDLAQRLEFYEHDEHWQNRMILGDSLAVMTSLAEKEGLKGRECIYLDPPGTGKIAVKVINHYGDEVLKVYRVGGK